MSRSVEVATSSQTFSAVLSKASLSLSGEFRSLSVTRVASNSRFFSISSTVRGPTTTLSASCDLSDTSSATLAMTITVRATINITRSLTARSISQNATLTLQRRTRTVSGTVGLPSRSASQTLGVGTATAGLTRTVMVSQSSSLLLVSPVDALLKTMSTIGTASYAVGYASMLVGAAASPAAALLAAVSPSCGAAVPTSLLYLLSPFADYDSAVVAIGNASIILVVFVAQLLAHRALFGDAEASQRGEKPRGGVVSLFVRCPSFPVTVCRFFLPGVVAGSTRCVVALSSNSRSSSDESIATSAAGAGAVCGVLCVVASLAGVWRVSVSALRKCRVVDEGDHAVLSSRRGEQWFCASEKWGPQDALRSYSSIVRRMRANSLALDGRIIFFWRECMPLMFCIAGSFSAGDFGLCVPQAVVLVFICLASSAIVIYKQPYVPVVENGLHCATTLVLGFFVASTQVGSGLLVQRVAMIVLLGLVVALAFFSLLSSCVASERETEEIRQREQQAQSEGSMSPSTRVSSASGTSGIHSSNQLSALKTVFQESDEDRLCEEMELLQRVASHRAGLSISSNQHGDGKTSSAGAGAVPKTFVVTVGSGSNAVDVGSAGLFHTAKEGGSETADALIRPMLASMGERLAVEDAAARLVSPQMLASHVSTTLEMLTAYPMPPESREEQSLRTEALIRCAISQRFL